MPDVAVELIPETPDSSDLAACRAEGRHWHVTASDAYALLDVLAWVPVAERVPAGEGEVRGDRRRIRALGAFADGSVREVVRVFWLDAPDHYWWAYPNAICDTPPTHWMPLPPAPETT